MGARALKSWQFDPGSYRECLASGIALVALLCVLGTTTAHTEEPAPKGFSYDPTPVPFVIGGHPLQIPRSYVFDFVQGKVTQTSIALIAHLPDLSPISSKNAQCFIDWKVCDKIVYIEISDSVVSSVSEQLKRLLQGRRATIRSGPYGLGHYGARSFNRQEDTYGRALDSGQFYLVACAGRRSPFDACTYQQNADVGLSLKYVFKRTQLQNWESIHIRVTELLASFQPD